MPYNPSAQATCYVAANVANKHDLTKFSSLIHLNIRSLPSHHDQLKASSLTNCSLLALTETWCDQTVDTKFISVNGISPVFSTAIVKLIRF